MTRLNLIYAQARNGVIGKNNQLPWHLPSDLAHFKKTTLGQPVIMGRKTWDSLPHAFRPLPGRVNIVITQDRLWQAHGAKTVHGLTEAIQACEGAPEAWVIGGAQIYALALPHAQRVVVTHIHHDFDGDAYAPHLDTHWVETLRVPGTDPKLPHDFVTYERTSHF